MRKTLLVFLLLVAREMFGASGDPLWVSVESDGSFADICFSGGFALWGTNVTPVTALGTNSSGISNCRIGLDSIGYTTNGLATIRHRGIFTTRPMRWNYGTAGQDAHTVNYICNVQGYDNTAHALSFTGPDLLCRFCLSDRILASDSNLVCAVDAGILPGSTANANLTVSNLSTVISGMDNEVCGNWTWPGWRVVSGSTMRLRAMGFHPSATHGNPLACAIAVVSDEHGNVVSNIQTSLSIDYGLPDALHFGEYLFDIPTAQFTNLDSIRCDFVMLPWVGDSATIRDTTLNTYSMPTTLPASITNVLDKTGLGYSTTIAVVDAGGSDSSGRASTNSDPTAISSGQYFLTIANAALACQGTNNSFFGHNDVGGATIYVRSTISNYTGANPTLNVGRAWAVLTNYPGDNVTLAGQVSGTKLGGKARIRGITIAASGAMFTTDNLWFDRCTINASSTSLWNTDPLVYITDCNITNCGQGLQAISGGNNTAFPIIRGNNFDGFGNANIQFWTCVGNIHPATNAPGYRITGDILGQVSPMNEYGLLYNNYWGGLDNSGTSDVDIHHYSNYVHGVAILQNVFEITSWRTTQAGAVFCTTLSINYTNICIFNCDMLGWKSDYGYNDLGVGWRIGWRFRQNIWEDRATKCDNNLSPYDGSRTQNWQLVFGVGCRENVSTMMTNFNGAGNFYNQAGYNEFNPQNSSQRTTNLTKFINRQANSGSSEGQVWPGGGDYHMVSEVLPAKMLKMEDWYFRYDLFGAERSLFCRPGPFASDWRKAALVGF